MHQILSDLGFLTLEYDAVEEYIHAIWRGEQTDDTIRQGYEQILYFLRLERCSRLLDDHLAIHGVWVSQASWFAHDWYPRAVKAGLQYHTVVYSQDYFSQRSTQQALDEVPGGLVAGFTDVEVARKVLLSM